jgi:hypothetical protein
MDTKPKSTKIYAHRIENIPAGEHWAILTSESVTTPGDERSRTNPGHGYPEHTDYYFSYVAFTDKAEFEAELQRELASHAKYSFGSPRIRGIHIAATYTGKTVVAVEEKR